MVSKNQIKRITSLHQKKFRNEHQLFIAEGVKVIQELLQSNFVLEQLLVTENCFEEIEAKYRLLIHDQDMKRISALSTPSSCLAVFHIPESKPVVEAGLIVALDAIRDPGNLGTIIRLCDWFGVKQLVCSKETVDVYNPKVIQATMGSISRVNVVEVDLPRFIADTPLNVYGTFMDGANVYQQQLTQDAVIVLGNEANGISKEIEMSIKNKLAIPRFGDLQQTESLNVATATAIFLSEFRRSNTLG
jgi:TrmH family RNA methyltransferase